MLHGGPCGDAIGAANQILVSIKGPLIAAAQDPPNAGQSRAVMPGVVPYIPKVNRDITKARQQWLAGGYPADSPAVRDIDAMLAALDRLVPLAKAADLNAISKIYLDLNSALDQYVYDSGAFCTQ